MEKQSMGRLQALITLKATDLPVLNCGPEHPYRHVYGPSIRTLNTPFCLLQPAAPSSLLGLEFYTLLRYKMWAAKSCQALVQIYLCLRWKLQLITERWQDGNCIMKNIPSTFLGLLHITTLCGVATQCSSLEKVEKPGYGSIAPPYVPIAIIFPKPSNV